MKKEGSNGKFFFGLAKVGNKGQIVIPREAREVFNISAGDSLIVLGDIEQGLALIKADSLNEIATAILNIKDSGDKDNH